MIFYNDLRACGKGFEELFQRSVEEGIEFIQAIPSVYENRSTRNPIIVYEDPQSGRMIQKELDLVVLACGLQPSSSTREIRKMLGLKRDSYGFVRELHPIDGMAETTQSGIFIAGVCQGPKDIPDSATHGSAAAAKVGRFLSRSNTSSTSDDASEESNNSTK